MSWETSLTKCIHVTFSEGIRVRLGEVLKLPFERGEAEREGRERLANWDLLRSISMFAVLVVHAAPFLGIHFNVDVGSILGRVALLCDPVFFTLSGYFAIRALRGTLSEYYWRKTTTVLLPLFLCAAVLYPVVSKFDNMSLYGFFDWFLSELTPWWFIPTLTGYLVVAPFLYLFFESLNDRNMKALTRISLTLMVCGMVWTFGVWLFEETGHHTVSSALRVVWKIFPTSIIENSYFIYFCLGYFVRRLSRGLDRTALAMVTVLGCMSVMLDVVFSHMGALLVDPSFYWIMPVCAVFFWVDRLKVQSGYIKKIVEALAKRSYSIYLFNFSAIAFAYRFLPYGHWYVPGMTSGLIVWLVCLLLSYLLSLVAAIIFDSFILRPTQTILDRLVRSRRPQGESCD